MYKAKPEDRMRIYRHIASMRLRKLIAGDNFITSPREYANFGVRIRVNGPWLDSRRKASKKPTIVVNCVCPNCKRAARKETRV